MSDSEDEIKLAVIAKDIEYIKDSIKVINRKLDKDYVTKMEFEPVKRIVYGMVGIILVAVLSGVVGMVVMQ